MDDGLFTSPIDAEAEADGFDGTGLVLTLHIADPDLCDELEKHEEGRLQHDFAIGALKIGVMALHQARGRIDSERIRAEGDRLLENLAGALAAHQSGLIQELSSSLKGYFDPQSGRFSERIDRLIKQDGELEQLLRRQIGGDDSELVRTLSAHIGNDSALMRLLDPQAANGLLSAIGAAVGATLTEQRERILQEFSLDNKEGALSRLVAELSDQHAQASESLAERIQTVISEFSLDRDDSALSRLVRRVEQAQTQISSEFSLDEENSALARMRRELFGVMEAFRETNEQFHKEVLQKLAENTARKQEANRSTRHGHEFEEAVFEEIDAACRATGDLAERTGASHGVINKCKKGDILVHLGSEHAAAGARIVIEAKEQASFSIKDALAEIEEARKNRDAGVGLVVLSERTAPASVGPFHRHGNDVLVVWDRDDCGSDVNLAAGLSVAKALCTRERARSESEAADLQAIERAIRNIEKRVQDLDEISTWAGTIQNNGDKIVKKAAALKAELMGHIATLDKKVGDLGEMLRVPS